MIRKWHIKWGITALVSILLWGCKEKEVKDEIPQETGKKTFVYQDLDPQELLATLEKRYYVLKNFSSQPVNARVSSRNQPFGSQRLSGSIVLLKPNKIRLSIAKHHSPIRLDAICDGENFWVLYYQQKSIYVGKLNEPLNNRGKRLAFNPLDILRAIFCTELSRDAGFEYRITFVEVPNPNYYVIVVLNGKYPNKLYSKIWVNRTTLHIERHQLFKPDIGEIKLDAAFSDFVKRTKYDLPHAITLIWPDSGTKLELDLKGLRVNRTFNNPNLFKYDYANKGFGEIRVTGKDVPSPRARMLQERDTGPRHPQPIYVPQPTRRKKSPMPRRR
ncbi:MAG: hypothetical protein GXP25_11025 [Planctomycetes bacterium]|nr:hypothetical protein [Planctomycetota bacterium]